MYSKELEIGKRAVLCAGRIIRIIQRGFSDEYSLAKSDKSPVTVADFLSQAIICNMLNREFPQLPIVAEEDSEVLKKEENRQILEKILSLIDDDQEVRGILNSENLFDSIDLGGQNTGDIFWTLDPIDGTKGFLRGEQFAVALALIVQGEVKLGVLGCPNLKREKDSGSGFLFYAIEGNGTEMLNVDTNESERIHVSGIDDTREMRFVQSYVSSHSNLELQHKIAKILKIKKTPVQLDSQVKYGLVASGQAEIYLRIPNPKSPNYKEKIWDHAAGSIIVDEAGGSVSDILGNKLDFSSGKTLKNNTGILSTIPGVQKKILDIIGNVY